MSVGWLEYLQQARWFASKDDGRLAGIEPLEWYTPPGSLPAVRSELARIERAGSEEIYHLLVGYLPAGTAEPEATVRPSSEGDLPSHPDGLGPVEVVDAAASPIALRALLDTLGRTSVSGLRWRHQPASLTPLRILPAEQSNSAVVAGDTLLKVYRRLSPGVNPEPELLAALEGHAVPALHGVLSQAGYDLLVAIEFLADAQDGWALATAACARNRPLETELHDLGRALRDVHHGLVEAFGTRTMSGTALRRQLLADLEEAISEVPQLAPHHAGLASVLAALPDDEITTQRVHGDFHLGQVLLTADGWRIIDFEGEPGTTMTERRAYDSRWRDVAGLLRSLDYVRSAHPDPASHQAREWCDRSRAAFLAGYGDDPAAIPVMSAHEVARMVYEVEYEVRNRPDWVGIPLSAVENVATRHGGESNGV